MCLRHDWRQQVTACYYQFLTVHRFVISVATYSCTRIWCKITQPATPSNPPLSYLIPPLLELSHCEYPDNSMARKLLDVHFPTPLRLHYGYRC